MSGLPGHRCEQNIVATAQTLLACAVGDDSDSRQQIGLEYQINNVTFGELCGERTSSLVTTTGRLKLKLNLN